MSPYTEIIHNESENLTTIQKFYNNTVIFITGCTGFLGQLLVEKLLRSCPNVRLYLLVREKKDKDPLSRLDDIFNSVLFEKLEKENPEFRQKVDAVVGDCGKKDLGLSVEDKELLVQKVHIIFHLAATVRFDEKLKLAVDINIKGTEDLLKMAKEMKQLKSFVYVSTLFANCPNTIIEENFYPAALEYNQLKNLADSLPDNLSEIVTANLLCEYPNTYAFTKQIAESVVEKLGKNLPIGVFRPAIVISTYKEPIRGWINNLYGPAGYAAGAGAGLIRVGEGDMCCNANIIPADMTVSFMIALAWDVWTKNFEKENTCDNNIYNYASSNDKPLTWKTFVEESYTQVITMGLKKCIWYYSLTFFKNHYIFLIMHFLLHIVPAAMVDFVRLCIGKPPKMLKIYTKIAKFAEVISYFCKRSWTIKDTNYRRLCDKMSPKDKDLFACDLRDLDWEEYLKDYVVGIRVHLIHDPLETLEEGKRKYKKLYWIHQITKTVLTLLIIRMIWTTSNFIYNILM